MLSISSIYRKMLIDKRTEIFLPFCFTFKVISSIRIKYPNYYNLYFKVSRYMSQRSPFIVVYFSWWLTYCTPICFQTCTRKQICTRASGIYLYPYTIGTLFTYGIKPGRGERETEHGKEQIWNGWILLLITVSSTELIFHFYVSWHGKGQSERNPPPRLFLCFHLEECNMNLLYLGSEVNYLLDLNMR